MVPSRREALLQEWHAIPLDKVRVVLESERIVIGADDGRVESEHGVAIIAQCYRHSWNILTVPPQRCSDGRIDEGKHISPSR